MGQKPYALSVSAIFDQYKTSSLGLTSTKAKERQARYGLNQIAQKEKTNYLLHFLLQFTSPLVYILIIAAIISGILGHLTDTWLILVIVLFNALIGWIQEIKAEKSLQALKKIIALRTKVIRDNEEVELSAIDLVPGDIIVIEEGTRIPADSRLIEAKDLKIDESILTGESVPNYKTISPLPSSTPLADQTNMVFASTIAVGGRGRAVVVNIGKNTEIGEIGQEITALEEENSPLILKIKDLSKKILYYVLIVCLAFFVLGLIRGMNFFEMFLTSVAAAVAVIPEGLPAVITLTLTIGVHQLSKQSAIIRKLVAVEALGSVTVIATDKTGTLTLNQMTVEKMYLSNRIIDVSGKGYWPLGSFKEKGQIIKKDDRQITNFLKIAILCNNASLIREDDNWHILGDPTEGSLITLAAKFGIYKEDVQFKHLRLDEVPFSSEYHFMATLHSLTKNNFVAVKGSIEKILHLSKYIQTKNGIILLNKTKKQEIIALAHTWAGQAYRIIACAYKKVSTKTKNISINNVNSLIFTGFCAIEDPPRLEAASAIKKSQLAGIRPIMVTGDHPATALAIAVKLGIAKPNSEVITGYNWQKLSKEQLKKKIEVTNVYARISPWQKLEIIDFLQKNGEIVGMTGDGVNDAPVLKKANIGIAMGIGGTDVAREASEMILVDNNFATLVNAITIGRTIFSNIRKAVFFLISTNIGEAMTLLFSLLIGLPLPLIAVQILWTNVITDSYGGLSLTMESADNNVMRQAPRPINEGILTKNITLRSVIIATIMAIITLSLFFFYIKSGASLEKSRSIAFATMSFLQIMNLFNARSFKKSIFHNSFFTNKYLLLAVLTSVVLTVATVSWPIFTKLFQTVPLDSLDWFRVISFSVLIIVVVEIEKIIRKISNCSINE
ncbi:MAG: HAD-IC family P-type ATPase [Patescibacteria group bacterium]|nr:HAD-IC family P-type ATPase [Patescibacteria group bacterium]